MYRPLAALALAVIAAAPVLAREAPTRRTGAFLNPYPAYERKMPDSFYSRAYRLTPADYYRFRAAGLSRDEVFMIANAASLTGIEPGYFAQMIFRGFYARAISTEFGLTRRDITRVDPEWKTPEWAEAVGESVYTRNRLNVWF